MVGFSRFLTWLLELDRPTPVRTEEDVQAEVARNYRWNFTVNLLDGVTFWFGSAFLSGATIIPLFVSKITLNPLVIGLVATLTTASWYLPQLLTAGPIERLDRKKPVLINAGLLLERLPVALLPFAALMAADTPYLALLIFILVYAWFGLGAGVIAPAWQDLLASCFPVHKRGWMFGITAFIGNGAAAFGALVSTWALAEFAYPYNFALVFGVAAASILVSWCFLAFLREPAQKLTHSAEVTAMSWWTRATTIVRDDGNFRRFVITRALMVFSMMGAGFLTVAAIQRFDVPDSTVGWYTFILLVGQTAGNLTSGLVADRWGHKVPMLLGGIAQIAAFTIALWVWRPEAYYAVFVLVGFNMGVNLVSGILIALEFSAPERRPSYVGIANTTVGVAGSIAPLFGGWLAYYSYSLLFGACVVLGLAAVAALFVGVHDPRWLPVKSRALPESA